jgi:hypothetical protein
MMIASIVPLTHPASKSKNVLSLFLLAGLLERQRGRKPNLELCSVLSGRKSAGSKWLTWELCSSMK